MKLSIGMKAGIVVAIISLISFIPFTYMAYIAINKSNVSLNSQIMPQLIANRELKKKILQQFFKQLNTEMDLLGKNPNIHSLYNDLFKYYEDMNSKHNEAYIFDTKQYKKIYTFYSTFLFDYIKTHGFSNLFIFCAEHGHIMFTLNQKSNLGKDLSFGQLGDSHMASLCRKVLNSKKPVFKDFEVFTSDNNLPTALMGTPIFKDKKILGIIVIQFHINEISEIMSMRDGMGKTGETYLVGPDKLMRSNSYLDPINLSVNASFANPSKGRINTEASRKALNGITGEKIIINYMGDSVLSAFTPLQICDITWALIAEINENELIERAKKLSQEVYSTVYKIGIILFILIICSIIIISFFMRNTTKILLKVIEKIKEIARGNLDLEEIEITTSDEIGEISKAFNKMLKNLNALQVQAELITSGDLYNDNLSTEKGKGMLNDTFSVMIEKLREIDKEQKKQDWQKTGYAQISNKLRGDMSLIDLCQNILNFIARYINAQVGIFYIVNENNEIRSIASFAFDKRKGLYNTFKFGEGMVGQAALEKKMLIFSQIPSDYISIYSGTGNIPPKNIFVIPLIYNEEVKGIIELGTINDFSQSHRQLLESISESIAINIHTIKARELTEDLLEKSNHQSKALQKQQNELKMTNEELNKQTQKLKQSELYLKKQQEELRVSHEELEEKTDMLEMQKAEMKKNNVQLEKSRKILKEKAKALETSTRYKSEFLANMSHELRTPLNSLMILSKNLAKNKKKNLTKKQVKDANLIYEGGNELLTLINDILDLSKIEAGKMSLNKSEVFYSILKRNIINSFQQIIDEKGLELHITIHKNLPESLFTDQQKLEQIIKNLVSNAIKFTSFGKISIDFKKSSKKDIPKESKLNHNETILISVSDTGIGIPESKCLDIFEAFQQADGSISRQYGGTGLGLSIVKQLTNLLGGEIKLESKEGHGSTFTVFIAENLNEIEILNKMEKNKKDVIKINEYVDKIKKTNIKRSVEDDRNEIKSSDRLILIIEDDLIFTDILGNFCHEEGFKFIHAEDGETGLELLREYKVNAIFLDINLPGLDGWSVLKKLKRNTHTRHIPVHLMSVESEPYNVLKKGAIGYLKKPISENSLKPVFDQISKMTSDEVKKMLIVEDNHIESQELKEIFSSTNVDVDIVSQGKIALEKINSNNYDCMILDLELPDISGFELIKQFDKIDPLKRPPVIVNTAREITDEEHFKLNKYASSIIFKGPKSMECLLDEAALFLHSIIENLPDSAKHKIKELYTDDHIFKGKKILIVDDDVRNIYSMVSILEDFHMNILKAGNGEIALNILEKNPDIDLVIMDIMMPVMDGYQAIEAIRKQKKYKNLPIIVLTAKVMKKDREYCFEVGATDYIVKPVDPDKLISSIRVWLQKI